jgi:two-component system response regulator NreC
MSDVIRVLLVDDHGVVRAGIKSLLESQPDLKVVGEASRGEEAIEKAVQLQPDIVLMDIAMPGIGGIEATRRIRERLPNTNVLALTMHDNEEYFFAALKAGASGYVLKECEPQELLSAIYAVHQGNAFLSPAVAKVVVGSYLQGPAVDQQDDENFKTLTQREVEVFNLVAEGKTNREIADELFLSVRTVEKHRASMMSKLGIYNRTELIKYAIRKGLIDVE